MNCREWEEPIALYCGGELDGRRRLEVERHLAGCTGCQIFASGIVECLEEMRGAHREEIPAAHFAAVRARALARLQAAPWWRRRWLGAAAAAALACGAWWLETVDRRIREPVPPPKVALARPAAPALAASAGLPRRHAIPRVRQKPAPPEEPLTVRIVTDDPDVVIYWITSPKEQ